MKFLLVAAFFTLASCSKCKEIGKKENATPDEVQWYAKNCTNM